MEFIVINVCTDKLIVLKKTKILCEILDSSEAIQVIAASLFIALACLGICLCKRTEKYQTNRQRRPIHRRNKHG